MLIDHRERQLIQQARLHKLPFTTANLDLGDIVFVATVTKTKDTMLLPYMIERKTTADLAASMLTGNRLGSQRFRIQQSGVGQPILLLEEVTAEHEPLDPSVLRQVVANCQMESDMFIHHSSGLEETSHYLKLMLEYLEYRMTVRVLLL